MVIINVKTAVKGDIQVVLDMRTLQSAELTKVYDFPRKK